MNLLPKYPPQAGTPGLSLPGVSSVLSRVLCFVLVRPLLGVYFGPTGAGDWSSILTFGESDMLVGVDGLEPPTPAL